MLGTYQVVDGARNSIAATMQMLKKKIEDRNTPRTQSSHSYAEKETYRREKSEEGSEKDSKTKQLRLKRILLKIDGMRDQLGDDQLAIAKNDNKVRALRR